jgi:hypothetical protein
MTNGHEGFLVLDRLALYRLSQTRTKRIVAPSVGFDAEETFKRYRGFDGAPWPELGSGGAPFDGGLVPMDQLASVREYFSRRAVREEFDLIALVHTAAFREYLRGLGWRSAGYDVGYFESEWAHYSGILNEVLFGSHGKLRAFASRLNGSLLFDRSDDADAFVGAHLSASAEGADVEHVGEFSAIEIFIPPNAQGLKLHAGL